MRNLIVTGAVMTSLVLTGCESATSDTYTNSSGSLALSRNDGLLYAADSDNDIVAIVDTQTEKKIGEVKVGRAPERVIVAPDDTVYVTNRFDRSVSVIRPGEFTEAARIAVGLEPVGMAVSPDNKTLYVVNSASRDSAEEGSLQAIDTATLQTTWEIKVGEEPRAIALVPGNKALISLYRQGEIIQVDLANAQVTKGAQPKAQSELYQAANRFYVENRSGLSGTVYSSFKTRAASDIVVTPDGKRAFVPAVWAREDRITAAPNAFGGYYANGGPCNLGAIATAGVVTVEADTAKPLADDLTSCSFSTNSDTKDFPPSTLSGSTGVVQGPTVAAVDPTGAWLFVVNRETQNVAILPTGRRDGEDIAFNSTGSTVRALVNVGDGANGIALTRDGKRAFVYNAFDHSISVLVADGSGPTAKVATKPEAIKVASDDTSGIPADVLKGRRLFYDARDQRMSNLTTGVACASCHLEGRDDGHVWMFPDGPRQTPSLAGRMMLKTAPFHWNGEFGTLQDFMTHTTRLRMGGVGVTESMSSQIASFIDWQPSPENPYKTAVLSDRAKRGAEIFVRAECNSCHAGEALTNNKMANVGTYVTTGLNVDDLQKLKDGLNTPSLLALARSAPYLHDGSAGTLKERLMATKATNLHGKTAALTDAEMDDLVEYLKTL